MQIVLVYLQLFWRNSLLARVSLPEIAKNYQNPLVWGFKVAQGHQGHTLMKLVASVRYDTQYVFSYL